MVELQKFPYPYQAAFTVASDIDSANVARFRGVHALFCQEAYIERGSPEWSALGLAEHSEWYDKERQGVRGLGLDFADSFFLVRDPTTFGMYQEANPFVEDQEDGTNCAALIRRCIQEGQIDSFHAFLHYRRDQVEPLLRRFYDWCEETGASKPRVWINHSAGVTPTGLCPDELQPNRWYRLARLSAKRMIGPWLGRKPQPLQHAFVRYAGDTPGSPYYINDLLSTNGLRFVWLNVGDLHCNRMALPEIEWRGRRTILSPVTMDDGVRYHRFARCYGRAKGQKGEQVYLRDSAEGCDASALITEKNLAQLCDLGATCILYTHWTHHRSVPISDEAIRRFRLLRDWRDAGKVWVARASRLLEWTRRRTFLDYTWLREGERIVLEIKGIDDPLFGYERLGAEELEGLCFRFYTGKEIQVVVNGRVLSPDEVGREADCVWLKARTITGNKPLVSGPKVREVNARAEGPALRAAEAL